MNEKICLVSTVKAPIEQIKSFVNYHLNNGIDHIFLFFDDPEDQSIYFFKRKKKITCFLNKYKSPSTIENRQRKNANLALKIARKKRFDWIIHLDVDELIWTRYNLKSLLKKFSKKIDYVRIATLEAIPEKMSYKKPFNEITLFKNNFHKISKIFFKAHACGKSFIRTNANFDCIGIHRPSSKKNKLKSRYVYLNARLLHYFCYNYNDWKRKWIWRIDGTGTALEIQPKDKKYLEKFKKVYKQNNEEKLKEFYKRDFLISNWKKRILLTLGIIIRIKLNPKLFEKNED